MRRILPTTYAAIATTAAVGIVLLRISFPVFLHQGITEAISAALPFGFQAREISVDFLRNRAVFGGVLAGDGRFTLLAPRVIAHFSLAGFSTRDLRVTDISIERPLLRVRGGLPLSFTTPRGGDDFPRVTASDGRVTLSQENGEKWRATGVALDWSWETLALTAKSVTPPPSRFFPGELGLSFNGYRVREGWDVASKATWSDGDLDLQGRFEPATGVFRGEGDYRGVPVAGFPLQVRKLHCSFTAQGSTAWGVHGAISTSTAVLSGVPLLLTGTVAVGPEGVRVADLSALLPQGKAVLNGEFRHDGARWTSSGTALLSDLSPVGLAVSAGILKDEGLPEISATGGSVSWNWPGEGTPLALSTNLGLFFFRNGAGGQLHLAAVGSVAGGALSLSRALITWPDNRLHLSGNLSPKQGWETAFELTTTRLSGLLGMIVKDFTLLDGGGSYRGNIRGALGSPEISGEVALAPFAFGHSVIEKVSGPLTIRGANLSSTGLLLRLRGGAARLDGSITVGEETALDLQGELENYPLADLVGMFLPPWATAARVSTRFSLKGIEERSNGGGPTTITGLSFGDVTVGKIAGPLLWTPGGLSMKGARIESSVGDWSGDLSLPFDGKIRGTIASRNLPLPPALVGVFSSAAGSLGLSGTLENPSFDGLFRLGWTGVLAGQPDLVLKGSGNAAKITVSGRSEGILEADGVVEPATLRFTAVARGNLPAIPLSIPRVGKGELTVSGIRVAISGAAEDPTRAVGEVSWDRLALKSPVAWARVDMGPATVPFQGGTVTLDALRAVVGPLSGIFSGTLSTQGPRITARGEAPVSSLSSLISLPAGIAVGDGTADVAATIAGTWTSPKVTGEVLIPRCTVTGLPLVGTLPGVEAALIWDGEKGTVTASALHQESILKGSASFTSDGFSPIRIEGTLPVAALSQAGITLLKEGSFSFSGEVPVDNPLMGASGRVTLKDGAASLGDRGKITALRGEGAFEQGILRVDSFSGLYGEGEITGSAMLDYTTPALPRWEATASARGLFIKFPGEAELLLDSDVVLTGTPKGSSLKGRIILNKGSYLKEIAPRPALRFSPTPATASVQVPRSISATELDLEIVTRRPFELRSNQADAAFEGRLRATGSLGAPIISGEIRAVRGDFYYLSRRFKIATGSVLFTGGQGFDPFIILSAATEVGTTKVYLNTQSNLSSLSLGLSSSPPYGREDIIALLTFGQTVTGLKGKGEATAAIAAASIVGGELLGRFQEEARRSLALSVFQINPETSQGSGDTDLRFTLGKKLSDRLFVSWSQRLTGSERQSFTAEYRILDFLTLTGERDSEGQNNFDLKVDLGF
jgi:hypothetical protein